VTLDNQATDDALTLGVTPVGIAKISFVEGGVQEWTKAELRGKTPPLLDVDTALPYERSPRCAPTSSWRLTPTCWTARPTTD